MSQSIPEDFFKRLKDHTLTESDRLYLEQWFSTASSAEIKTVFEEYGEYFAGRADIPYPDNGPLVSLIERAIDKAEQESNSPARDVIPMKRPASFKKLLAVAATFGIIGFSLYLYRFNNTRDTLKPVPRSAKIIPGGNKATLTLSSGKIIPLDSAHNGMLATQNSVHIYKATNERVVYDASQPTSDDGDLSGSNTITTPRGGQYQLVLPDGSNVWLNASSSLTFPVRFSGKNRTVTLTGEGYFEVAKDKSHPFKVMINDSEVEVLGTHFNIMGYKDEGVTAATLLEGSVKIIKGEITQTLKPGQQATISDNVKVTTVNANEAIEWKNGNFNFAHENLQGIMRKIARWYDVDIIFQGPTTTENLIGTIPRSRDIKEVLKYLELTGEAHFKIKERSVIVMP
jgi:transmembrane sensor